MKDRNLGIFRGLESPEAPTELHKRTMHAALDALARPAVPDIWTRLWQSRALRLAWTCCVALLAIGHIAVTPLSTGVVTVAIKPTARQPIESIDEVSALARLPRLDLGVHGLGVLGENVQANGRGAEGVAPTPHHRKENAS